MKYIIYKANERGHANHGWLNAYHSFSFANWHHPDKVHFGVLRVLNDDTIAGGMGFGMHPHDNMEIITIPLEGALAHKDSMGNAATIETGDIQVMSAGTGVMHSEFNPNPDQPTKLFQIWLFPNKQNVTPRYQQITLDVNHKENQLIQILSPNSEDEGVWIHQDAWFYLGNYTQKLEATHHVQKNGNGVYLMCIEGSVSVNNEIINRRDAIGIWETEFITFEVNEDTKILLMDIPMEINL
ncbi:pirin family protein [Flavobacterium sp.]|uniref:pirin family protein n=1 Tax=Flavobacterium sp. TaxID=239 RepID=UPI003D0F6202